MIPTEDLMSLPETPAVRLALDLGRANVRLRRYEATEAHLRAYVDWLENRDEITDFDVFAIEAASIIRRALDAEETP